MIRTQQDRDRESNATPTRRSASRQGSSKSAASRLDESRPAETLQRELGNQAVQQVFRASGTPDVGVRSGAAQPTPVRDAEREMERGEGYEVGDDVAADIESARGSGRPLDGTARREMRGEFGSGLGGVAVHTGSRADRLARRVDAEAFASGRNVFFRRGNYAPGTPWGNHLLAHELTHATAEPRRGGADRPATDGVGAGFGATVDRYGANPEIYRFSIGNQRGVDPSNENFYRNVTLALDEAMYRYLDTHIDTAIDKFDTVYSTASGSSGSLAIDTLLELSGMIPVVGTYATPMAKIAWMFYQSGVGSTGNRVPVHEFINNRRDTLKNLKLHIEAARQGTDGDTPAEQAMTDLFDNVELAKWTETTGSMGAVGTMLPYASGNATTSSGGGGATRSSGGGGAKRSAGGSGGKSATGGSGKNAGGPPAIRSRLVTQLDEQLDNLPKATDHLQVMANAWVNASQDSYDWGRAPGTIYLTVRKYGESTWLTEDGPTIDDVAQGAQTVEVLEEAYGGEKPLHELPFDMEIRLVDMSQPVRTGTMTRPTVEGMAEARGGNGTLRHVSGDEWLVDSYRRTADPARVKDLVPD